MKHVWKGHGADSEIGNVSARQAAFNRWTATDKRYKRKVVYLFIYVNGSVKLPNVYVTCGILSLALLPIRPPAEYCIQVGKTSSYRPPFTFSVDPSYSIFSTFPVYLISPPFISDIARNSDWWTRTKSSKRSERKFVARLVPFPLICLSRPSMKLGARFLPKLAKPLPFAVHLWKLSRVCTVAFLKCR